MQVKLDFSEDCKSHNYDLDRPGTYAIYVRKNMFHKWQEVQTYADIHIAMLDYRNLTEAIHLMKD